MNRACAAIVVGILAVGLCASAARADIGSSLSLKVDPDAELPFPAGSKVFTLYGGYVAQPTGRREEIAFLNPGVGYYVFDNISLNLELSGLAITQQGDDAVAGSVGVTFRHHVIYGRNWSIYGEVGFACFEASKQVPEGGTKFNFNLPTGIGATFKLKENLNLLLGARYLHISNAKMEGADRNPSVNAVGGYVGLMWQF